jgi:DNA-binding response OmpR family regulator
MGDVRILVIDDDATSQSALRQILDSEGWKVAVVPMVREGLVTLATGDWKLVIVNVAMTGVEGPLFTTLKELAQAEAAEGKPRVGVLFLVPELAAYDAKPVLEKEKLPYVLKPYHLHDFLERVSDLLMETRSISDPIRQVRRPKSDRRSKDRRAGDRRNSPMFASRKDYYMTEEEIAEYEKQEAESRKKKEEEKKDFV